MKTTFKMRALMVVIFFTIWLGIPIGLIWYTGEDSFFVVGIVSWLPAALTISYLTED